MDFFYTFINKILSKYIIYTKILQWVNFDFLSFLGSDFNKFLRKFTDNAPYIDEDIDYKSIEKLLEIGSKYSLKIDKIPINSGTISLVFKGEILDKDKTKIIAIKILRNGIEDKIHQCIDNFTLLFGFIKNFPFIKNLNLDILLNDVKDNLLEQVDFKKESNFIKIFDSKLNKYKHIKTIKLIEELTFDNVIVMEFIEGRSLFKLNCEDKKLFGTNLISSLFYTQMKKQLFHLDLHPGNILYTNDNKIVFLDLGMAMKLDVDECNFIIDFLKLFQISSDKEATLITIFKNYSHILFKDITKDENIIKSIISKKPDIFRKVDNISFVNDTTFLLNELSKSGVRISKRINEILFGLISFINIFITLNQDMHLLINENLNIYIK